MIKLRNLLPGVHSGNRTKSVLRSSVAAPLDRFARDTQGNMTIMSIFMFASIVSICGVGVDLMLNENQRVEQQAMLDRAVLAAADLDQERDPEGVVREYFAAENLTPILTDVRDEDDDFYRLVSARSDQSSDAIFTRILGIDSLQSMARATAQEKILNLEISLILDISGSMRYNERLSRLRPAAQEFVTTVVNTSAAESVTINLVPYAGMTNPGDTVFNYLDGETIDGMTGGSHCLEIETSDFEDMAPPANGRSQVPHFMNWTIASDVMDWGWCPSDAADMIWASGDAQTINNRIGAMRMHDGTGTHYAMKWGVAALNPDNDALFTHLRAQGEVAATYADRPLAWNAPNSRKMIVLMTDGQITEQVRPIDPIDPENAVDELQNRTGDRTPITTAGQNVQSFFDQCDLAKDNGVIVYTIAFEAPSGAKTEMRNCASSPSHFFEVEGLEIETAFQSIANNVHQLKLIE